MKKLQIRRMYTSRNFVPLMPINGDVNLEMLAANQKKHKGITAHIILPNSTDSYGQTLFYKLADAMGHGLDFNPVNHWLMNTQRVYQTIEFRESIE